MSRDVTYIAGMAIIHIADTLHVHATPFGFNTYAAEFLDSFKQFKTSRDFSPVRCYLVRRSIELSLKCFLPGKGVFEERVNNRVSSLNQTSDTSAPSRGCYAGATEVPQQ